MATILNHNEWEYLKDGILKLYQSDKNSNVTLNDLYTSYTENYHTKFAKFLKNKVLSISSIAEEERVIYSESIGKHSIARLYYYNYNYFNPCEKDSKEPSFNEKFIDACFLIISNGTLTLNKYRQSLNPIIQDELTMDQISEKNIDNSLNDITLQDNIKTEEGNNSRSETTEQKAYENIESPSTNRTKLPHIKLLVIIIICLLLGFISCLLLLQNKCTNDKNCSLSLEDSLLLKSRDLGLLYIENDGSKSLSANVQKLYLNSKKEIVITGPNLDNTFQFYLQLIKNKLNENINVYIIILNPNSAELPRMVEMSKRRMDLEIQQTIGIIKLNKLTENKSFHIRFFDKVPKFTAIMIDGNLEDDKENAGIMRVEPRFDYDTHQKSKGPSLVLTKIPNKETVFDAFAYDLKKQWENAKEINDYFK